jgi:hypothetical protein
VVRAYKGEGKSALLRLVKHKLSQTLSTNTIVDAIGPDISPSIESVEPDIWASAWKKSILQLIARNIGASINIAFGDDAMSLVEEAETSGFRERSFISSVLDRLKPSGLGVERKSIGITDFEQTMRRRAKDRTPIWVIVDDIDQNFSNTEKNRVKVASFLPHAAS